MKGERTELSGSVRLEETQYTFSIWEVCKAAVAAAILPRRGGTCMVSYKTGVQLPQCPNKQCVLQRVAGIKLVYNNSSSILL